jgi:hypothetical protein
LRLIAVRSGVAAFVALAALAWHPAVGAAAQKVIESPGSPLSSIYVDSDLACQVHAAGDAGLSFLGGTEPGSCGTFLAYAEGEFQIHETEGRHVWGPSPEGAHAELKYEPIEQKLAGKGTASEPFVVTTVVRAIEPVEEELEQVAELTETDSYVAGQDFYTTKIAIKNMLFEPLEGALYHAGDCHLSGFAAGYGAVNVPEAGAVACTIDPGDSPPARLMALTPAGTTGGATAPRFLEGLFSSVWSDVNKEATQFPDTVAAATDEDNGMGLSWPITLAARVNEPVVGATVSFKTAVSPSSPPTSSSTAGACVSSGQIPITVSAVNGAKAVDYVLDGGPEQAIATGLGGQATIALTTGQHTLEYWGEDQTGAQEATHHVLSVTVASGGPSLTITSDQGHSSYEVGEAGSVSITATGPGLTSNPSAAHVPISTTTPGTYSVSSSAADACGTTNASFSYTVIPPPVLGKSVNVDVVSGKVFVALPATGHSASSGGPLQASFAGSTGMAVESLNKGLKFVPLTEARQIPVGSILQTTAGVARITTATASKNKQQSGDFGAGIFKLLQARKQKGLTELDIMNAHTARQLCATIGKKRAVVAKLSSKVLGRLNANAHGKFTTKGQYSAATVRGTVWSVTNQCDGTLTKVQRGVVSVRDFVRRKTITLFTGQHYLARTPF